MKALNCLRGYDLLLKFAQTEDIPFEICGKIIVAIQQKEIPILNTIYERGIANGLKGLKKINSLEIREYEKYVFGLQGIVVPQTGIIDFKLVARKYAQKIQEYGGSIELENKIQNIKKHSDQLIITTNQNDYRTKLFINATGLYSDKIAKITNRRLPYRIIPFRGEYYELKKSCRHLVNNLIYPVPNPNFPFLGCSFYKKN